MKRLVAIILILITCLFALTSCGKYKGVYSMAHEIDFTMKSFTSALFECDYEKAMTNVHPDSDLTVEDLQVLVNSASESRGVTLPQQWVRYKIFGFWMTINESEDLVFEGNTLKYAKISAKYTIVVDGVKFKIRADILYNENGFGILTYNFA